MSDRVERLAHVFRSMREDSKRKTSTTTPTPHSSRKEEEVDGFTSALRAARKKSAMGQAAETVALSVEEKMRRAEEIVSVRMTETLGAIGESVGQALSKQKEDTERLVRAIETQTESAEELKAQLLCIRAEMAQNNTRFDLAEANVKAWIETVPTAITNEQKEEYQALLQRMLAMSREIECIENALPVTIQRRMETQREHAKPQPQPEPQPEPRPEYKVKVTRSKA